MNKKTINVIISAGTFCMLLLIVVQIFWARSLVEIEEKQFNHKVKIALTNAGYELRLIQHSTIDKVHFVKQINDESFVVEVQDIVNPVQIDTLLKKEFKTLEIERPYKIAIYDCFTDSVLYSQSGRRMNSSAIAKEKELQWDINSYNFGVIFSTSDFITENLNIWITSLTVIGILTSFFIYMISLFIKQKKISEMKTDFINNMTHELKTPISTISLSSQVLKQKNIINQPDRLYRYAEIIEQENNRLKNQVERVLQISFFEADSFKLNFKKVDISLLLKEAMKPFSITLEESGGHINFECTEVYAEVDDHHFTNIISNLIENAIKYRGESVPTIDMALSSSNSEVCITLKDKGIGIPEEHLKHIFKKFYRVPTGDRHDVKGFGIGLSYVELVVNKHHGKITIKSVEGEGTSIEIYLPKNQKS